MKKIFIFVFLLSCLFLFSNYVYSACTGEEIPTAVGCISVGSTSSFTKSVLQLSIGIAGGVAFLLMLFATFQIMTSAGNPDKIKAGKELLTSAVTGLMLIIFSVFLLQLIGQDILQLPGFGSNNNSTWSGGGNNAGGGGGGGASGAD